MKEPKNIRDLQWMRKTSCDGWINGQIKSEYSHNKREYTNVYVDVYTDTVTVRESIDKLSDGVFLKQKIISEKTYDFDEFRASEYWNETMNAWSEGDTDASWMEDCEVWQSDDHESVGIETVLSRTYRDWLGNYRQASDTHKFYLEVDRMSGEIQISYDNGNYSFMMGELDDLLRIKELLKQQHIKIEDDSITVRFDKE